MQRGLRSAIEMLHFSRCGEASTETLEANVWNHQISIRKPVRTLELSHFDTFAGSHSAQGFAGKLPVDRNGFDKGLIRDRTVMKLARNRYIACGRNRGGHRGKIIRMDLNSVLTIRHGIGIVRELGLQVHV